MNQIDTTKHAQALAAAKACFSQYGFKRTAMEDIAQQAGMSRPALYLLFPNKETIFRVLSQQLHDDALEHVAQELAVDGAIEQRLTRAIEGKVLAFFELVRSSPHASELVDADQRWAGDVGARAEQQFRVLLTEHVAAAATRNEIDLGRIAQSPAGFVDLLTRSLKGLKDGNTDTRQLRERIAQLVAIFIAAVRPTP